jgi:hypothetical protein
VFSNNPISVFVSHLWLVDDDYLRVFEYLGSARNFFYKNTADPEVRMAHTVEAQREQLRSQISAAEVVLMLSAHHAKSAALTEFQANFAKSAKKPLVLLKNFGLEISPPASLQAIADEVVDWNERSLADALRRHARHEDTSRWDSIDYTPP